MRIYFVEDTSANYVAITDGDVVKCYYADPTGIYEGVDLYHGDTEKELRLHFQNLAESGEMAGFDEMESAYEYTYQGFLDYLSGEDDIDVTKVYDDKREKV